MVKSLSLLRYVLCIFQIEPLMLKKISKGSFLSDFLILAPLKSILFQYCYNYCYSDSRSLCAVMKAGGLAL